MSATFARLGGRLARRQTGLRDRFGVSRIQMQQDLRRHPGPAQSAGGPLGGFLGTGGEVGDVDVRVRVHRDRQGRQVALDDGPAAGGPHTGQGRQL